MPGGGRKGVHGRAIAGSRLPRGAIYLSIRGLHWGAAAGLVLLYGGATCWFVWIAQMHAQGSAQLRRSLTLACQSTAMPDEVERARAQILESGTGALPILVDALRSGEVRVRREAYHLLLALQAPGTPDRLAGELEESGQFATIELIEAFAALGDPADWREVLPALRGGNLEGRVAAASALGALEARGAADELASLVSGTPDGLSLASAAALSRWEDPRAVPVLIDFLRSPAHWRTALLSLRGYAGATFGRERAQTPEEVEQAVGRWTRWWKRSSNEGGRS